MLPESDSFIGLVGDLERVKNRKNGGFGSTVKFGNSWGVGVYQCSMQDFSRKMEGVEVKMT